MYFSTLISTLLVAGAIAAPLPKTTSGTKRQIDPAAEAACVGKGAFDDCVLNGLNGLCQLIQDGNGGTLPGDPAFCEIRDSLNPGVTPAPVDPDPLNIQDTLAKIDAQKPQVDQGAAQAACAGKFAFEDCVVDGQNGLCQLIQDGNGGTLPGDPAVCEIRDSLN
ncbi:hypothetical protein DL96DRAFT_1615005 [Flagelloscypha sp. PMI_526]|nr:hypothetical protein DL96DRAFT_1615005 [Flagelloscypha sp. PMI_526]